MSSFDYAKALRQGVKGPAKETKREEESAGESTEQQQRATSSRNVGDPPKTNTRSVPPSQGNVAWPCIQNSRTVPKRTNPQTEATNPWVTPKPKRNPTAAAASKATDSAKQNNGPWSNNGSKTVPMKKPPPPTTVLSKKSKKPKPHERVLSLGELLPKQQHKHKKRAIPSASKPKPANHNHATTTAKPTSLEFNQEDFPALMKTTATTTTTTSSFSKKPQQAPKRKQPQQHQVQKHKVKKPKQSKKKPMITTPQDSNNIIPREQRQGGGTELLDLMLKQKQAQPKAGRQRIHPRKKKFTTLKKKVLQERLEQWRKQQQDQSREEPHNEAAKDVSCCFAVCVKGFCTREELEDEDESHELLLNLQAMAVKIGLLKDCFLDVSTEQAFCLFERAADAQGAVVVWDGLVLGGQPLQARVLAVPTPMSLVPEEDVDTRLKKWRQAVLACYRVTQEEPIDAQETNSTVILDKFLTIEDFQDEDELQESLADVQTMASVYGSVKHVHANKEDHASVTITFDSPSCATNAAQGFDGRVIGGQVVSVRTCMKNNVPPRANQDEVKASRSKTVALANLLTVDDMEDEDCLEECVGDVQSMAAEFGKVERVETVKNKHGAGTVLVTYSDENRVKRALQGFSEKVIGGQRITATLYDSPDKPQPSSWVVLTNVLTQDDLEDADCLEETKSDITELADKYGRVVSVKVDTSGRGEVRIEYKGESSVAALAADSFDGMVIGGQAISAKLLVNDSNPVENRPPLTGPLSSLNADSTVVQQDEAAVKSDAEEKVAPMFSGDKLIPERFAECKRVPKIANPVPGPRHYATLADNDRVKPMLVEMLGELMRLQKRAMEDKNAKARRRIVMGLREVARGIRAHKVKMVVMANNLDQYGVIDEKLQNILDLARQEHVPVFFEFSKRTLGKAVLKKIKVAVVGIQNPEGAHQQFKKLANMAPPTLDSHVG